MRHRSIRVRALITDPVIPQTNGRPRLCHWCQRKVALAGGFNMLLTDELEHATKGSRGIVWRQKLSDDAELSEHHAWWAFRMMRWHKTNGEPMCPKCGGLDHYWLPSRRLWKCKNNKCYKQFSATSETPFNSMKLSFQQLMKAFSMLECSALQIANTIGIDVKNSSLFKFKAEAYIKGESFPKASFTGAYGRSDRGGLPPVPVRAIHPDGTTKEYLTVKSTEEDGFRPSNVSQCLAGTKKTHKGVKWERL